MPNDKLRSALKDHLLDMLALLTPEQEHRTLAALHSVLSDALAAIQSAQRRPRRAPNIMDIAASIAEKHRRSGAPCPACDCEFCDAARRS